MLYDYYTYKLQEGHAPNTVIHRHANTKKYLKYAFQLGSIASNPADKGIRSKKNHYETEIYNEEEMQFLFEKVKGTPLQLAIVADAFYPLRRSEVSGLK